MNTVPKKDSKFKMIFLYLFMFSISYIKRKIKLKPGKGALIESGIIASLVVFITYMLLSMIH